MLNRGKRSLEIDLKAPDAIDRLTPLLRQADILVEQFRPGVMDRLGLGYAAVQAINSRMIYCSITGWGQTGPKSRIAGHDLNYMAETGLLGLTRGADGSPVLPPVLAADIGGGAYPAVINILLALQQRDRTGEGSYVDVAMGENLFTMAYWALGEGFGAGRWPTGGDGLTTGRTARYQIYRTSDGQFLAAAPVEEQFWQQFCEVIKLPQELRDRDLPQAPVIARVAAIIQSKAADEWRQLFDGKDVCCSIATSLEAAVKDPHFVERGVFSHRTAVGETSVPALPVPVAPQFRKRDGQGSVPELGEAGSDLQADV
jgi:crotonobetainyl-CoA:carnitine CoA-transferase CaiB-like acyl-CoA transferase